MTDKKAELIIPETERENELYFKGKYEVEKSYHSKLWIAFLIAVSFLFLIFIGSWILAYTDKPVEVKNLNTNSQSIN